MVSEDYWDHMTDTMKDFLQVMEDMRRELFPDQVKEDLSPRIKAERSRDKREDARSKKREIDIKTQEKIRKITQS